MTTGAAWLCMAAAGGLRVVLGVEIALLASRARLKVVDPARPNLKQNWLEAVNELCYTKRGEIQPWWLGGRASALHSIESQSLLPRWIKTCFGLTIPTISKGKD